MAVTLVSSELMRWGGFAVVDGLVDHGTLAELGAEAWAALGSATAQESCTPDPEEDRGGTPRRRFLTAEAGTVQDELYASLGLRAALSDLCAVPIVPSGNRGSYSYYVRPGDFLGLHRDIETCDVAMITVLHDDGPGDQSGALVLYPGRITEPLSAIRARPREGACVVTADPGQTVVMLGGLVPHFVRRVAPGQARVVSVLCFRSRVPDGSGCW